MNTQTPYYTLPLKCLIVLVLLLTFSLNAVGQSGNITLTNHRLPIGDLISQIENETQYRFAYVNTLLNDETVINLPSAELPLEDALETMASQLGLKYLWAGKYITFVKRAPKTELVSIHRTKDRYRPTNIKDLSADPNPRPISESSIDSTEAVPFEPMQKSVPVYYSAYRNPDIYTHMQFSLPKWGIKTNLLYAGITLTPNISAELGTGLCTSIELTGSYNPWNWEGGWEDNKKQVHYMLRAELRWWLCERFNGHYVGPHIFYNNYNVGQTKVPTLFKKEYQYEGWAVGAGVSYGYNLPLGNQWGLEFTAGLGGAYLKQSKYRCGKCGEPADKQHKWYFGPTRVGINLAFILK